MSTLYEELCAAGGDRERRTITGNVIDTMRLRPDSPEANAAYYGFCAAVIHRLGHGAVRMSSRDEGRFPPLASAALVMATQRVSGFLGAIHRVRKVDSAIEAGPGASAVLSIGAARRGAHVIAVEVNPGAAECAQEVVRLTGFAGQIEIRTGDALTANLSGGADIAIAELLGPGLRGENGPAVIAALKGRATHIIPDAATLYAIDAPVEPTSYEDPWQKVADVDLTDPALQRVTGVFSSTGAGLRSVRVRADILAGGREIVAGLGTDDLTSPATVGGTITVPHVGVPIEFAYDIGPTPHATPDYVHIRA